MFVWVLTLTRNYKSKTQRPKQSDTQIYSIQDLGPETFHNRDGITAGPTQTSFGRVASPLFICAGFCTIH